MEFADISWSHISELFGLFATAFLVGFFSMWFYFKLLGKRGDAVSMSESTILQITYNTPDEAHKTVITTSADDTVEHQKPAVNIADDNDVKRVEKSLFMPEVDRFKNNEHGEKPAVEKSTFKLNVRSKSRNKTSEADDLQLIEGIGPTLEKKLNKLGITQFSQIAAWTREDVAELNKILLFSKRIDREDWIGQAAKLAQDHQLVRSALAKKNKGDK